jgi:3-oxoacyl-[acyl-carrier-protein] synthase-3
MYSRIVGTGSYLPERGLTNSELEGMLDTTDEWIRSDAGIRDGRIKPRDLVMLEAFGGGLTWGSALIRL